jgi:hypothetical protein
MVAMISRRWALSKTAAARASRSARTLCWRCKGNAGCARTCAYQSRRPGVPVMDKRSSTVNQISGRRGCPVFLPVVVMSMGRSRSRACVMDASILRLQRLPRALGGRALTLSDLGTLLR